MADGYRINNCVFGFVRKPGESVDKTTERRKLYQEEVARAKAADPLLYKRDELIVAISKLTAEESPPSYLGSWQDPDEVANYKRDLYHKVLLVCNEGVDIRSMRIEGLKLDLLSVQQRIEQRESAKEAERKGRCFTLPNMVCLSVLSMLIGGALSYVLLSGFDSRKDVIEKPYESFMPEIADSVYFTESGKRFHSTKECESLKRSQGVYTDTRENAERYGLTPCSICCYE